MHDGKEGITFSFHPRGRKKCGREALLAGRIALGPRAGSDWQIAADLRKQLIIPQETANTGLRAVVVRGSGTCLGGKAGSAKGACGRRGPEGKCLGETEAAEAVQPDGKDKVHRMEDGCKALSTTWWLASALGIYVQHCLWPQREVGSECNSGKSKHGGWWDLHLRASVTFNHAPGRWLMSSTASLMPSAQRGAPHGLLLWFSSTRKTIWIMCRREQSTCPVTVLFHYTSSVAEKCQKSRSPQINSIQLGF